MSFILLWIPSGRKPDRNILKERSSSMKVLVINAGSSSLKYQLMDPATKDVLAKGLIM